MSDMYICPTCKRPTQPTDNEIIEYLAKEKDRYLDALSERPKELYYTRKALDKGMECITGLNNMIESWYKLLQSDKDTSTKYATLKSAISAYVENKGGDND